MKQLTRMLTIGLMALAFAVPGFAKINIENITATVQDDDAKNALYTKVTENISKGQAGQAIAYEAAKEYLQKWPTDDDAIAKYLKDFVFKYERATRKLDLGKAVAAQKWPEAYALGKLVIADEPTELVGYYNTSWAGMQLAAVGNNINNVEAMNFATKTIQMIEDGKVLDAGKPYADSTKQKDLGWLNYSLYLYSLKGNMSDAAVKYLIKAAEYESPFKTDPNTYLKLAAIYGDEFEKRRVDYSTRFDGKDKTPEGDAAFERVKQEADLLIDSIARAIAYSGTDPKTQTARDELKKTLTDYYKFRNGSIDGLDAMIAGIKSKPLPKPGDVAPSTTPTTTTPTTTTNGGNVAGTKANTSMPATSTTPATGTAIKPTTVQAGTPAKKPATATAGNNGRRPRRR